MLAIPARTVNPEQNYAVMFSLWRDAFAGGAVIDAAV